MNFHVPRKETQTLTHKIDNINIEQVDEFNFLGLILNTNLTRQKKHVNKIANKCSKTICVLNKLKHILPLDIKTLLYNSTQAVEIYLTIKRKNRTEVNKYYTYVY